MVALLELSSTKKQNMICKTRVQDSEKDNKLYRRGRGCGIGGMGMSVGRGWSLVNILPNAIICAKLYQGASFHSETGKKFIGTTSSVFCWSVPLHRNNIHNTE